MAFFPPWSSLPPSETPPSKILSENNRKISITIEINITVDFAPLWKNPGRNPETHHHQVYNFGSKNVKEFHSTADTCKNCAKRGKGLKFGTYEAFTLQIKIELGAFKNFSLFVCMPIWLLQTQVFHWSEKFKKIICLHSKHKSNSCKEVIKLIKINFGTTLIGSMVAEIFNSKGTSKVLSQHFYTILSTLKHYILARISSIHLIHVSFWFSLLSSFQLQDLFLK